MNTEEREMVLQLLNWIEQSGELTASDEPMMQKAQTIFGFSRDIDNERWSYSSLTGSSSAES